MPIFHALDPLAREIDPKFGAGGFDFVVNGDGLDLALSPAEQEVEKGDIVDAFPRSVPSVLAGSFGSSGGREKKQVKLP